MSLLFAIALAGCECTPFGLDQTRFTCTTQEDCADGFECRDMGAGLECVAAGTGTDAGRDAGVDAGLPDAGDSDAGLDAGETDSGVDAGEDDAGFDAGVDAGFDAGQAGPPTQLRFATAPQSVATNACSQVINVETLGADGGVTAVSAPTTVMLQAAAPGGTLSFFTASNCSGAPTTSVVIAAMQSSTSFYASSPDARTFTMTASSPPLAPATQNITIVPPPTSLVFTTTPPNPVRGGTCLTATVEARRGSTATPVGTNTTIGLTATPSSGTIFYSDGACTTTTTSTTMPAGSSSATFFVKPLTGGVNAIAAAAPFGTANQNITTTRIVRRGSCDFVARVALPDGGTQTDTTNTCSFFPGVTDLTASMLITQATAQVSGTELGVAEVRCRLASNTTITCVRRQDLDPASVHFQIAEVPQGMLVQRSSSFSCPATTTLATPVNLSRAFVLKAAASTTQNFDDEDAVVASLASPTTVTLFPTTCEGIDLQVVDWAGITVARGAVDGGVPMGAGGVTVTGLTAASNNRAMLIQPGISSTSTRPVCASMIRAVTPSPSSIAFTRAAGNTACNANTPETLNWERIDFGNKAAVREYTANFVAGDTSASVTITPVDTSRTIVFSGSQIAGGQGAGETDHDGTSRFTEAAFQLVLTDPTTVTVTRAENTSAAIVTFYVAELLP